MAVEPDWEREPVSILGLSPKSLQRLARRGVRTVRQICGLTPDELLDHQNWMSANEMLDRRLEAEWIFREIQTALARFGLAMRGDGGLECANKPLSLLGLSVRASNHAQRRGITTVGQLCELTEEDVLVWGGFGETTLREVREALARFGLRLRWSREWSRGI